MDLTRFRGHLNVWKRSLGEQTESMRAGNRRKIVELVRAWRKPRELSKEFCPTPWSIALWIKQEARDAGRGADGRAGATGANARRPLLAALPVLEYSGST